MLFSTRKCIDLSYLQPVAEKILAKQRQGYQRNEMWAEYCAEAAKCGMKAYKLSRFNEIVSEYRKSHDISFTMDHVPGLEGQVDWTGDHGHFTDIDTGKRIDVHVFVMSLPYSGYFYSEGFLDEKMPSWYAGHVNVGDKMNLPLGPKRACKKQAKDSRSGNPVFYFAFTNKD